MKSPHKPVIIYGNPPDGFTLIGPFETLDAATQWAEENLEQEGDKFFWPAPLFEPDEFLRGSDEQP